MPELIGTFRQLRAWCPTCRWTSPLLVHRADVTIADLTCPDGHPVLASPGPDDAVTGDDDAGA